MTRTTNAPRPTVNRTFGDPLTQMWQTTTDVTRYVVDAYTTGLNIVLEQQRAMQRASEGWLNGVAKLGSAATQATVREARRVDAEARQIDAPATEPARRTSRSAAGTPRTRRGSRGPAKPTRAKSSATSARATSARATSARATSADAAAEKSQATPRTARRRAVTPTSKSALAKAVGPALATWTPEGYDTLTAAEVTEKLAQFSQSELREVQAYEQAHQARTTILQRIDALQGEEPVAGYDGLTVPEVESRLASGDAELATRVRDYERAHKNRDGVLRAVEAQLA